MSKAQYTTSARRGMRALGGFATALMLLLVTVPGAGGDTSRASVELLNEVDPLPRWHSVVLSWEGTKVIEGEMILEDPDAGKLVKGGDESMGGYAVVFEIRQPNGTWWWFASVGGVTSEISSHDTRVRVRDPIEVDVEHNPHYRLVHNNSFGWRLTSTGGTYRVTTWAAAEHEGKYRAPLRAEPGVMLLNHTEGETVHWRRADDTALVSSGASAQGHGVWARALAEINANIEQSAYIFHTSTGVVTWTQQCVCRYTGPPPDWDGGIKWYVPDSVYNGPRGTYAIDVFASINSFWYVDPFNPARVVPSTRNNAFSWIFADVTPAEA